MKTLSVLTTILITSAIMVSLGLTHTLDSQFPLSGEAQALDPGIFVAGEGIRRVNSVTLATQWHVLGNTQTFSPAVLDDQIIVGSSRGLFAIEKKNGVIRWSITSEDTIYTPVISDNIAYAGSLSGHVMAIDINTGVIKWKVKLQGWVYPPALSGKYVIAGGSDHHIVALNRSTGDMEWDLDVGQELVYRPVRAAEDQIAITTFANETILINSRNGKIIWIYSDTAPSFSPRIINNQIVSGMLDGRVRSLGLSDGRLMWKTKVGGLPQINVFPSIDALVVLNGEGMVTVLDTTTGNILWKRIFVNQVMGTFQTADNHINVLLVDNFDKTWSIDVIDQVNFTTGGQNEM